MNATLKRILPLMLATALLGGCAAQKQPAEPTEPPETATPVPTEVPWTPEPTITPRTFDIAIEMPSDGATPLLIHPRRRADASAADVQFHAVCLAAAGHSVQRTRFVEALFH